MPVPRPPRRGSRTRLGGDCASVVGGLVFEEVELDIVVAGVHAQANLPRSFAPERKCPGRTVETEGVLGGARARPLPRPLPAAAPAGLRRDGARMARPGRTERSRRRTEDRRPRGQVAATGPSARLARPPRSAIRAASGSSRWRATRPTSTSPTSTSPAARCVRRCAPASSTTRAAIEVAAQISEALAHAHGKGIVHRDVKPSNVLLAQHLDTEPGTVDVRLLDFGLAQMAEFDTLTAPRRHPRHARLHLAGASAGPDGHLRRRRLGGRRAPLGGAGRRASVLGRRPDGDLAADPARRGAAGRAAPRPAAERAGDGRERPLRQPAAPPVGRAPRPRAALAAETAPFQARRLEAHRAGAFVDRRRVGAAGARGAHRARHRLGGGHAALLSGRLAARGLPRWEPRSASRRRASGCSMRSPSHSFRSRTSPWASRSSTPPSPPAGSP